MSKKKKNTLTSRRFEIDSHLFSDFDIESVTDELFPSNRQAEPAAQAPVDKVIWQVRR